MTPAKKQLAPVVKSSPLKIKPKEEVKIDKDKVPILAKSKVIKKQDIGTGVNKIAEVIQKVCKPAKPTLTAKPAMPVPVP